MLVHVFWVQPAAHPESNAVNVTDLKPDTFTDLKPDLDTFNFLSFADHVTYH